MPSSSAAGAAFAARSRGRSRIKLRYLFMGMMLQGVWRDVPRDFKSTGGAFVRPDAAFRESVSLSDAEPGRFCLYVSRACPWAHRTLIVRAFARLEKRVPVFDA